jgi:hypothetical protein
MTAPGTQESGHRFDIKVHRDTMPLSLFRNGPPVVGICRGPLTGYILTRRIYGEQSPTINDGVSRHAEPVVDNARAHGWQAPTVVNT